jgi:multidrug efflux pump subunit AcrB
MKPVWIVQLALRRTYTFVVMALLIAAVSGVAIFRMSTDIFPEINIPVVSVVWQFTGMPADEIERRIILPNERVLTTSVNDIEHIQRLGTVQGARVPQPWGGKWPQVMVDLDLDELYARGLSPQDIQTAINSQNLIIPAGTAKIGSREYYGHSPARSPERQTRWIRTLARC